MQVPDPAFHQRMYEIGGTQYTYNEIAAAIREFDACEQEYRALAEQGFNLIKPHEEFGTMGIAHAPESIQKLYWQLDSQFIPGISVAWRAGGEHWPVKTWQKQTTKYRTLIRKVRQALDACIKVA